MRMLYKLAKKKFLIAIKRHACVHTIWDFRIAIKRHACVHKILDFLIAIKRHACVHKCWYVLIKMTRKIHQTIFDIYTASASFSKLPAKTHNLNLYTWSTGEIYFASRLKILLFLKWLPQKIWGWMGKTYSIDDHI